MAEQSIHIFHNKHSNKHSDAEIIAIAVKILSAIESCGCNHCEKILTEVYKKNENWRKGHGPNHKPEPDGMCALLPEQTSS